MMFSNTVQYSRIILSSGICLATVSVDVSELHVKRYLGDFKEL